MKKPWALVILVATLFIARLWAPAFLLKKLNQSLSTFSPIYSIHVDGLDLAFWRMAYILDRIEIRSKSHQQVFLQAESVDVSLAWRELIRRRILSDIDVQFASIDLTHELLILMAAHELSSKKDAQTARATLFPLSVERLRAHQSHILFYQVPATSAEGVWQLSEVELTLANLTSRPANPVSLFQITGTLQNSAQLKIAGQAILQKSPVDWKVDLELHHFDLRQANSIFLKLGPLTFRQGFLDLYAEARDINGQVLGYARPFGEKIKIIGDKADFIGVKHFFVELISSFLVFVFQNRKLESVATQIDFATVKGKLKVNSAKAIKMAFRNSHQGLQQKELNLPFVYKGEIR